MKENNSFFNFKVTKKALLEVIYVTLIIFTAIIALLTIFGFFSKYGLLFDIVSHFKIQYIILMLFFIIIFLIMKRWVMIILAFLFLFTNLLQIIPSQCICNETKLVNKESEDKISILLINVNTSNKEYDLVKNYIEKINPDILALEEINKKWYSELSPIIKTYKYQKYVLREDNFGIGIFSEIKFNKSEIIYFSKSLIPSILSNIKFKHKDISILLTHPLPPTSDKNYQIRNEQLDKIGNENNEYENNLIIIGDLNTTIWSYHLKRLISKLNLYDSSCRFGIQPTWPTFSPLFLIPIDHILITKNIIVIDRKIGPNIGSDHYPVFALLSIL